MGYEYSAHRPPIAPAVPVSARVEDTIAKIDTIEECDSIVLLLNRAVTGLIDVCGADDTRPRVSSPTKVARRALSDVLGMLDDMLDA